MKMKMLSIALGAIMIGLGACGGSKEKSSDKEITSVVIGGQSYTKNGDTFSWNYPKSNQDTWSTEPSWPASIQITHTGMSISPSASTITLNTTTGAGVPITVKAEDGSEKTFTVRATRDEFFN